MMIKRIVFAGLAVIYGYLCIAQDAAFKTLSLQTPDAFRELGKNWIVSSGVTADYNIAGNMHAVKGTGILVNLPDAANRSHFVTKEEWGDMEVELDFMMAKGSNAGVYLQGRYEVQLFDSWTKIYATPSDCGGIYFRWLDDGGNYQGTPPLVNVAKAPGLWQHLRIKFRAPVFNNKGEKITNALFEAVYLNGVLIQEEAAVTGPTRSSIYEDEKATGPLMIQGDHGQVAVKDIRYRTLPARKIELHQQQTYQQTVRPILVDPGTEPYLLRSFVMHKEKKLTHVISVGQSDKTNFSYDIKRGALFQVWRGDFADVTQMWTQRGEPQTAAPRGSVIVLSDAPALTVLANEQAAWPDSISFDDVQEHGYTLTPQRMPVFSYKMNSMDITDSIASYGNGQGLTRKLSVAKPVAGLYCRVTAGETIEKIAADLYAVDNRAYYIRLAPGINPIIRKATGGQEMILPLNGAAVVYSIIW